MRSTDDVIFGVSGQTLRHLVRAGRPSAATYAVFAEDAGDDDDTPEWSGTATIDSVDTTIGQAAGVGQTNPATIVLTSATGVSVGRRYLISQAGVREWVYLVGLSGSTATASAPLQNAYGAGASFQGTEISATVDATWVADTDHLSDPSLPEPDYRVRWTVTVGGETRVYYTFFDLVRGAVGHNVTMHDVEARLWGSLDDLPIDHRADGGARIIDAAWADVQVELAAQGFNDAALRDAAVVDQLVLHRVRVLFCQNGYSPRSLPPDVALQAAIADYQRFLERHITGAARLAVATTSGAARKASPRLFYK